ncbi:hypothetical protein CEE69_22585 [Rhodopirellula bahusiensis]|uniref:Uncharacterized protein n=1 Tax=Rhodopirellula bahusiensis TaxID=2014065 RepID=A0A2G1W1W6_9BACT|nr:hypothetical protein CEE69_22585 [Rhodopirellula bahusiensis]
MPDDQSLVVGFCSPFLNSRRSRRSNLRSATFSRENWRFSPLTSLQTTGFSRSMTGRRYN